MYEIGDEKICFSFNRPVVQSIISELLIGHVRYHFGRIRTELGLIHQVEAGWTTLHTVDAPAVRTAAKPELS